MKTLKSVAAALLAASVLATPAAQADAYPAKPVTIVVGYAPGGATDVTARIIAKALAARWGQQVIVDNKAGASGMIGAHAVVRAAPDGYTLLLGYTPEVSINKLVYAKMNYDPETELTPIALVSSANLFLVSGPRLPVASFKELLEQKKSAKPVTYGSPGTGGQQHLAGEYLQMQTGLKTTHVPYRGAAPAVSDLLGGQIDVFFSTPPVILQHVKAGTLKPLMVTSNERDPLLPDVPSAKEVGLENFEIANWFAMMGPKGMDKAVVNKVSADLAAVVKEPAVIEQLSAAGLTARHMPPQQLSKFIADETRKYGTIIERSGMQKQ